MEDVGMKPELTESAVPTEAPSISTLDGWIESLMTCKQLSEADVQRLCDKVLVDKPRPRRATFSCGADHFSFSD